MTPNFFMYYVPAMTSPAGKRGAAAAAAAAIAQRAASSPEDSSSQVPTPSPAPRRRGRPRKNPVAENAGLEDECTLFSIIRSGKSSLQVIILFLIKLN